MKDTARRIIDRLNAIKPSASAYSDPAKLSWINEVSADIWENILDYTNTVEIATGSGGSTYALPEGVEFEDLRQVFINGDEYPRSSGYKTMGYTRSGESTVKIYPPIEIGDTLDIQIHVPFAPHQMDDYVLVETPYDRMYMFFISAMIDYSREDFASYNNGIAMYTAAVSDYRDSIIGKLPIKGGAYKCGYPILNTPQSGQNKGT